MSDRDRLLYELPTNVVVAAGAGTGKTHRLSGLYVHLVAGLTEVTREDGTKGPLSPADIVATTFTREAAAEMRARIEARLRLLAARPLDDLAQPGTASAAWADELRNTCARRGVPPPDRAVFRRALDLLPRATITTFHGWAGELVRAHPIEAGVSPGFALLEPEESDALLVEATTACLTEWVDDASDARRLAARRLLRSGLQHLLPAVRAALLRVAEEGISAAALLLADGDAEVEEARARRRAFLRALREVPGGEHDVARAEALVAALDRGEKASVAELSAAFSTLRANARGAELAPLREALDAIASSRGSIEDRCTRLAEEPERTLEARALEALARELLAEIDRRVAHSKRRLRALDFGDVLRRARDLLLRHPDVQADVARTVRALLVDEFQDTNALQRDLVYLARQGLAAIAARKAGALPDPSTIAETGLFLVGDRKQSIYAFRGADVAVFQQMAIDLAGEEARALLGAPPSMGGAGGLGRVVTLDENRRSVDEVLRFVNALAEVDMRGDDKLSPVERVVFQPELEALRAVRSSGRSTREHNPRVVVPIVASDGDVSADLVSALAIAGELRELLDDPSRRELDEPLRKRDVAILVRTYAALPSLELALSLHGLDYAVSAGRGLFATSEAGDLDALVRLALDPHDRNALVAVLRGPLCALSDRALLALVVGRAIELPRDVSTLEGRLEAGELRRLGALVAALAELRDHAARLPPAVALSRALERLSYERTLALLPSGEARLRDARRLVQLADRFPTGLAAYGRWLAAGRAGDLDEARGAIFDDEHDAIRVLTIHASKGLEFRVVVAMQLDYVGPQNNAPLVVARGDRGLALATRVDGAAGRDFGRGGRVLFDRAAAADRAERQRLTYVALTRARDLLYAVARPRAARDASAASSVERLLALRPELATRIVLRPSLEAPPPSDPVDLAPPARAFGEGELAPSPRGSVVVTTALSDYAACPRRFRLLHLVGLPEHAPRARDLDPPPEVDADALAEDDAPPPSLPVGPLPTDPRTQGVLAHLALERAPLATAAGEGASAYAASFLRAEGFDPSDDAAAKVAARIVRFLRSSYAQTLVEPGVRVERERPFVVELPSGVALRGTIDLLVVRPVSGGVRLEVVDYKSGTGDPARYALQLRAYAAACTRLARDIAPNVGRVEVIAGVAFLGGGDGEPVWLRDPSLGTEADVVRIDEVARRLLAARLRGEWPGIEAPACSALRCGFVSLCHPSRDERPRNDLEERA